MVTPELIDGIVKHIQRGDSAESIQQEVINAGYSQADFTSAYGAALNKANGKSHSWVRIALWIVLALVVFGVTAFVYGFSQYEAKMSSARSVAQKAAKRAAVNLYRPQAEIYFSGNNESYSGFCVSKPNPAVDCEDGATWYWVGTQVNDSTYMCVDSSGFSGDLFQKPTTHGCKTDLSVQTAQTDTTNPSTRSTAQTTKTTQPSTGATQPSTGVSTANTVQQPSSVSATDASQQTLAHYSNPTDMDIGVEVVEVSIWISKNPSFQSSYVGACTFADSKFAGTGISYTCKDGVDGYRILASISKDQYTYCMDKGGNGRTIKTATISPDSLTCPQYSS